MLRAGGTAEGKRERNGVTAGDGGHDDVELIETDGARREAA